MTQTESSLPPPPGPKAAVELAYRDVRGDNGARWTLLQYVKFVLALVELRSVVIDIREIDGDHGKGAAIGVPSSVICYNLPGLEGAK